MIDGATEILTKKQAESERKKARTAVGPAEDESSMGESSDCPICCDRMDKKGEQLETLDCQHEFHKRCISSWLKEKRDCPICRNLALPSDEFPTLK